MSILSADTSVKMKCIVFIDAYSRVDCLFPFECEVSVLHNLEVSFIHTYNFFFLSGVEPSMAMREVFKKFGLDSNAADFTGHAIALYRDDQ